MAQTTICPTCGWQNPLGAAHCGGCGRLLTVSDTAPGALAAPSPETPAPATSAPGMPAPGMLAPGMPAPGYPTPGYPAPGYPAPGYPAPGMPVTGPYAPSMPPAGMPAYAGAPVWQAAPQPPATAAPTRRKLSGGKRALIITGVVLASLVILVSVGWLAVARPLIHSKVDGAISSALTQTIASLQPITDDDLQSAGSILVVHDADANSQLATSLPSGSGIDRLTIAFQPGLVVLNYSAYGQQGTVQTGLSVQNGQVSAVNTQVTGLLGWVESGDELRTTLNQALIQMGQKTPHGIQSIVIAQGQMTITFVTVTAG